MQCLLQILTMIIKCYMDIKMVTQGGVPGCPRVYPRPNVRKKDIANVASNVTAHQDMIRLCLFRQVGK